MSLEVKELKKRVDHNTSLLDDLCRRNDAAWRQDPHDVDLGVDFPLSTLEGVQSLETKLEEANFARDLVRKMKY
jgi:hypothetical protein